MSDVYNDKIAGREVKGSTVPTDGQALVWDDTNEVWEPGTVSGSIDAQEGASGAGATVVSGATKFNFDSTYFDVQSPGGGEAFITLLVVIIAMTATFGNMAEILVVGESLTETFGNMSVQTSVTP